MDISKVIIFMPAVLILGILICFIPQKQGLKERYLYYAGKLKRSKKETAFEIRIRQVFASKDKEEMLEELSESLAYIKNISVLGRGKSISTVLLLEELSEFCPRLSKTYLGMAHYLSVNDKDNAKDALFNLMNDSYARDIGIFLAGWEDIPQEDLLSTIDAYKQAMAAERNTRIQKKDEMISDFAYFPVILNCMTILLNFIYVAYFINQKDALLSLFY